MIGGETILWVGVGGIVMRHRKDKAEVGTMVAEVSISSSAVSAVPAASLHGAY
jgi:hypothetical protein